MNKRLLLALLLAAAPARAAAFASAESEVPDVTGPAESFDKWLGSGSDPRDLAALVEHLHGRLAGGRSGPGLDQALGRADAAYAAQGGADSVQQALLYNGKQAREGLREAYGVLKDYADKLGKVKELEKAADASIQQVLSRQADAAARVKKAAAEAARIAQGIESSPPSSRGGDERAGELDGIESQAERLAEAKERLELAKEGLKDLEDKLKGMDALKARIKRHAEKAGLLDQGAGQALSASVTGKAGAAAAGSSKEILGDALRTLERAVDLGVKARGLTAAIVAKTAAGVEKAREAETAVSDGKEAAGKALAEAVRAHESVRGELRPGWEAAQDPGEKAAFEARAEKAKAGAASEAASAGAAAAAAAAACSCAKCACSTCPCAKKKAAAAVGDTAKLEKLPELDELGLRTSVRDGNAPTTGAARKSVDVGRMRSLMRGAAFDGGRAAKR